MSAKLRGYSGLELKNGRPVIGEITEVLDPGGDVGAKRIQVVGQARRALIVLVSGYVQCSLGALKKPAAFSARTFHPFDSAFGGSEVGQAGGDVIHYLRGGLRPLQGVGVAQGLGLPQLTLQLVENRQGEREIEG